MSYVNENIRILRNRMGLTQERFAEMIGINRKAVGSYEEGRATPPLDKLNKISKLFGVTIDQLTSHRYAVTETPLFEKPQEPEVVIHPEDLTLVPEKKKPFSRTGGQVSFLEVQTPTTGNIHYISHKFFDKYILDTDFESRLAHLPAMSLPFYGDVKNLRAFDVPVDSYIQEGIIIASKLTDLSDAKDEEYHIVVSNTKGILYKKIVQNPNGGFQVKADLKGETSFNLRVTEILELWKPVGFFSMSVPKIQPDLSALSAKINALKSDLDTLL